MTRLSLQHRALRGMAEGAATGFTVAVVRTGIALYRKGVPENIGSIIPELVAYFLVAVCVCAYIFAIGRTIADGISGSLLGGAVLAISSIPVGVKFAYDPTGPPYPLIFGVGAGILIGSPVGALIHQRVNNRTKPASDDHDSRPDALGS